MSQIPQTQADGNYRAMTHPTPSNAPPQWCIEAADELWKVVEYICSPKQPSAYARSTEVTGFARIIHSHAPAVNEEIERLKRQLTPVALGTSSPCPCTLTTPCRPQCSCASPYSSLGCMRCTKYGSDEQRIANAKRIAEAIDSFARLTSDLAEASKQIEMYRRTLRTIADEPLADSAHEDFYAANALDAARKLAHRAIVNGGSNG